MLQVCAARNLVIERLLPIQSFMDHTLYDCGSLWWHTWHPLFRSVSQDCKIDKDSPVTKKLFWEVCSQMLWEAIAWLRPLGNRLHYCEHIRQEAAVDWWLPLEEFIPLNDFPASGPHSYLFYLFWSKRNPVLYFIPVLNSEFRLTSPL